jgi:biopolymer transport protein ExbB
MLELFRLGGALMYPIALCSVAALAIILEKLFLLRATKQRMDAFRAQIQGVLKYGHLEEVERRAREHPNPLARIFLAGLEKIDAGDQRVRESIQYAGEKEARRLERYMAGLSTVVAGAPLLGFLGTVTGMIQAFQQIQVLGGSVNPSALAGGIWEAMITTAGGLFVAIPTLFAHNYLASRIRALVTELEEASQTLLDSLTAVRTVPRRTDVPVSK